jgi:quinol monooxygenase YgiN
MPATSFRVIARITAKPDKVGEMIELLGRLIEPTRAEPGCVRYDLLHNTDDPTDFTFVEEWADEAALAAHFETDHIKNGLTKFAELAAAPLDLRKYSVVR